MALYDGPIIDAHHHLWTYASGRLPWLDAPDTSDLARDFGAADYHLAAAGLDVVGTVWIEALAADPLAEAAEAVSIHRRDQRLCNALVAHAPLDAPYLEARLDRLQDAAPGLRGIRDIVAVRPGFASFARRGDLLTSPSFEAGLRALARRSLSFDLMIEPWQVCEALTLFRRVPDLNLIVEHAGNPDFRTGSGTALWRDAMASFAGLPNVAVKISALHCRMPGWTDAALCAEIDVLIDLFGVDRLAFASDFPTHDQTCPLARAFETFRTATAARSTAEQRALFHDTAKRLYRI